MFSRGTKSHRSWCSTSFETPTSRHYTLAAFSFEEGKNCFNSPYKKTFTISELSVLLNNLKKAKAEKDKDPDQKRS